MAYTLSNIFLHTSRQGNGTVWFLLSIIISYALAIFRSVKLFESVQGSGSEGDAVLYNTSILGLDWRGWEGREGLGGRRTGRRRVREGRPKAGGDLNLGRGMTDG